jgi:hypothetical protein
MTVTRCHIVRGDGFGTWRDDNVDFIPKAALMRKLPGINR